jgi:hypothetical protein
MKTIEQELVSVPVPRAVLPEVTALLHRYYSGELGNTPSDDDSRTAEVSDDDRSELEVQVPGNGSWTRDDIIELHASFRNETGRRVITMIAERSRDGRVATYGELMEHSGLDEFKLRSQLSWFSKKSKALKGVKAWPLLVTDAGSGSPKNERFSYRLHVRIAEWWLDAESR